MKAKRSPRKGGKSPTALRVREFGVHREVRVSAWALDEPERSYHANTVGVKRHLRDMMLAFAQVIPGGTRVATAVTISMPPALVAEALHGFQSIRERLERLAFTPAELRAVTIDWEHLNDLDRQGYLGLRADVIRAASGDDAAVLDFFSRPFVTEQMVEARPNALINFQGEIRITCPALVMAALLHGIDEEMKPG